MQNTQAICLGKGKENDQNYEDNIGKTPMGANGIQKVEYLNNNKVSKKGISTGVQKSIDWVL